jgi:putative flippase GtrA
MIKTLFINFWEYKFFRFIIVGIINTAFGYAVFAFLIYLKFHYSIAVLISTILGVLFNFKTIGEIVFNNKSNRLILRFCMVYFITYWLNVFIIFIFKKVISENLYLVGFLALIPVALITFFLNKYFVFGLDKG